MSKLIILKGLPGSGKSTYARKLALASPNDLIVVNRDNIRSMLGKYWVPSREALVSTIEYSIIYEALNSGYEVIVDATNLNPKTIKKLEKFKSIASLEYKEFNTSFWLCVWRDWKRGLFGGRRVDYKVIKRCYDKYYKNQR